MLHSQCVTKRPFIIHLTGLSRLAAKKQTRWVLKESLPECCVHFWAIRHLWLLFLYINNDSKKLSDKFQYLWFHWRSVMTTFAEWWRLKWGKKNDWQGCRVTWWLEPFGRAHRPGISNSVAIALRKAAFWLFERSLQVATAVFFRENDCSVVHMRRLNFPESNLPVGR